MDELLLTRRQENLHIVFWLIKDSCWMLEIKWLGTLMIVPALAIAVWIGYLTRGMREFYINVAIFFWILANSYWMVSEFFFENRLKNLAAIPFALGLVFVGVYYARQFLSREPSKAL